MNYVLDPARLVKGGKVVPCNPGASRLIQRIESREMPAGGRPRPNDSDLTLLRDWIAAGAKAPLAAERTLQTTHDVLAAINKHLQSLAREDRPFQRYFTLTHSVKDQDLLLYRAALSKLLNSLSWKRVIHIPEFLGAQQAVLAIDLRDLGWDHGVWQTVLDRYPYGLKHDRFPDNKTTQELADEVIEEAGTGVPFVRADWFIATASRPPLYHTLLGIPETAAELERQLGVDVENNFLTNKLDRAGFQNSGVSRQNRLIERHASQYGAYWKSYDFRAGAGERADLFHYPLGPKFNRNPFGEFAFVHAGGEINFHLPNA
ncbi:MAG: transcriptional regulator, partial [Gammaproteobacteria bacterium]